MPGSARRRVAAANHSMPAVKMIFAGGYHVEEARERACTASTREEKERDLRHEDGSHRRKKKINQGNLKEYAKGAESVRRGQESSEQQFLN